MTNTKLETTPPRRLRVLLVPDALHWATGVIAQQFARHPRFDATIVSGPVLAEWASLYPEQLPAVDLVHALSPWEFAPLTARYFNCVPMVASVYHVMDWKPLRPNASADGMMTLSKQWVTRLSELGVPPGLIHRVPLGVDTSVFIPATKERRVLLRKRMGFTDSDFVVGFSAKKTSDTEGRKGTGALRAALLACRQSRVKVAALITGLGWGELIDQLRAANIPVFRAPFAFKHADLAPIYQTMDAYWITSRVEGGPMPMLEAMACGVPCVCTPVGMVEEIIRPGENGFIVPFDDAAKIVDATREMSGSTERRAMLGGAARQTMVDGYTWAHAMPALERLYDDAILQFTERNGTPTSKSVSSPGSNLLRWAAMREELYWMRQLQNSGEPGAARRAWWRAVRQKPTSRFAWKHMPLFSRGR
jgi:glycosyltransferase involved in cell wall biosynthesis